MTKNIYHAWFSKTARKFSKQHINDNDNSCNFNNNHLDTYYKSVKTSKWVEVTAVSEDKNFGDIYYWEDKYYVGEVYSDSGCGMTEMEAIKLNKEQEEKTNLSVKDFAKEFAKNVNFPDAQEQAQAMTDFADGKMTYSQMRELCG